MGVHSFFYQAARSEQHFKNMGVLNTLGKIELTSDALNRSACAQK